MRLFCGRGAWLAIGLLAWVGCGSSVDPKLLAELRAKYVLAEEPADAQGVIDLNESIQSETPVVVVGVIGGVSDPWTKGKASFILVDPSAEAVEEPTSEAAQETATGHDPKAHGGKDHDPATCPFCSKKLVEQKLVLVEFVDASGKVVPVDARTLFELETSQMVVVRGQARKDVTGHVIVAANGLHVRR